MTATIEPTAHGRLWTYQGRRCRCDDCRAANRRICAEHQARRRRLTEQNGGVAPIAAHNVHTYRNWVCRCPTCRSANAAASRRNRDKAKAVERVVS